MFDNNYLCFTAYLRRQHEHGNNIVRVPYHKIMEICGLSSIPCLSDVHCQNDVSNGLSLGWMLADYVIVDCSSTAQSAMFQYNPDKVEAIFLADQTALTDRNCYA